jgi:Domain of unknown function (DUF4259)
MGTWGFDIFDDDTTLDVRGVFEDALAAGGSVIEATHRVFAEMAEAVVDYDDGALIWLALAALQLEHGAVEPWVQAPALAVIDRGIGLDRWEGADDRAQREAALAEFRARLVAGGRTLTAER